MKHHYTKFGHNTSNSSENMGVTAISKGFEPSLNFDLFSDSNQMFYTIILIKMLYHHIKSGYKSKSQKFFGRSWITIVTITTKIATQSSQALDSAPSFL